MSAMRMFSGLWWEEGEEEMVMVLFVKDWQEREGREGGEGYLKGMWYKRHVV